MKNIIFKLFAVILLNTPLGSKNCLSGSSFLSMPDVETILTSELLSFNSNYVSIVKDLHSSNKETSKFEYSIKRGKLIIEGQNWGLVTCSNNYFEIVDSDNNKLRYTKLKPTLIDCSKMELKKIIDASSWLYDINSEKGQIYISNKINEPSTSYRILNLNGTYVMIINDHWNFTIKKISKDKIEFYGLPRNNDFIKNPVLTRIYL